MWIALLLASTIAGVAPQPTSPEASSVVVHGRIVRSGTLEPLSNVQVTLEARPSSSDGDERTVLTDRDGRFFCSYTGFLVRGSRPESGLPAA